MRDNEQDAEPRLQVTAKGDVTVVEIGNRKLLDEINITQLGEQLSKLAAQSPDPKLVIDFTNVAHMSSSALGMLITLHKRICQRKGQLRLCNIFNT